MDPKRMVPKRGHCGMGTLEWLMIVGAVAGLAALAVVLVARLVDDTAEQVAEGGATANLSAAEAAAAQIEEKAKEADNVGRFETWNDWVRYYTARCSRLQVLYSTIGLEMDPGFGAPTDAGESALVLADLEKADGADAATNKPQVKCERKEP